MTNQFPGYHLACGAVPSNARKSQDLGCQDVVRAGCGWKPADYAAPVIAVLADGAGSAACAEEGAACASEVFFTAMVDQLRDEHRAGRKQWSDMRELMVGAVHRVRDELGRRAAKARRPIHDYATTLLAVVTDPYVGVGYLQIGDGGIVTGPPWALQFKPHKGASRNVTCFVTDDDALRRLQIVTTRQPNVNVVMFSDGLEDMLIERKTLAVYPPFFDWLAINNRQTTLFDLAPLLDRDELRENSADDMAVIALSMNDELRKFYRIEAPI